MGWARSWRKRISPLSIVLDVLLSVFVHLLGEEKIRKVQPKSLVHREKVVPRETKSTCLRIRRWCSLFQVPRSYRKADQSFSWKENGREDQRKQCPSNIQERKWKLFIYVPKKWIFEQRCPDSHSLEVMSEEVGKNCFEKGQLSRNR